MSSAEKVTLDDVVIIVPYINEQEIRSLREKLGWKLNIYFWEDKSRVGSDISYQTLWNINKDKDIFIMHSDMLPLPEDTENEWFTKLLSIVNKYPEAGMFGTTLLYPARSNETNNYYIQHAGGRFDNGEAIHIGGGLDLSSGSAVRALEEDKGQFDGKIREVPWVTFGGVYIRRALLLDCGNFDPSYYWTYYRDVDYCLTARSLGWKIYQTYIKLLHYEGKDNKYIQSQDPKRVEQVNINHNIFLNKWKNSDLLNNFDRIVFSEKDKDKTEQS